MSDVLTLDQYHDMLAKAPKARRPKYGNVHTTVDGIRFDSKLEASRYKELVLLRRAGEVLYFLRQVPFHLPGGVTYRCDFMVVWRRFRAGCAPQGLAGVLDIDPADQGWISFEDTKGKMTRESKNKIKQVLALYGVSVQIIR